MKEGFQLAGLFFGLNFAAAVVGGEYLWWLVAFFTFCAFAYGANQAQTPDGTPDFGTGTYWAFACLALLLPSILYGIVGGTSPKYTDYECAETWTPRGTLSDC